ncbi:MAG: agmatine deiminase family protein [Candidatus Bathyarchaeota archaeon]|nr:agmatine deiminase family protein [Candidatus Bathyarchaeota archaeon]MDW8022594.1 agmatine deiminase family protein [Nitrososphaerota archaeon]
MTCEFTMIPEFAPQKGVWLQWPTFKVSRGVNGRSFVSAFIEIIRECSTEGEVHIIVLDSNAKNEVKQKLAVAEVPLKNIFFHILPYDSCWIRDNGPIFVRKNGQEHILDFGFNAWGYAPWGPWDKDDEIPKRIANLLGIGYTTLKYVDYREGGKAKDFIYEGGAFEFSGEGTVIASWAICRQRNPHLNKKQATRVFKKFTGAHTVIWIDSIWPGTSAKKADNHTDGYIKFYAKDKVCVLGSEMEGPGKEAAKKLEREGWDVFRLPQGFRWTFVNCLIFNSKVISGCLGAPTPLEMEIMKELYPGKTIVTVEISPLAKAGGGVHCVTQQQPK